MWPDFILPVIAFWGDCSSGTSTVWTVFLRRGMGFARLFKCHVFWRNQRQILHKLKLIMPTYDYQCQSCGHEWELFQSMNDSPVKSCPKCKKRKAKRLMGLGAGLIFKGTGFYETDYKRAGSRKRKAVAKTLHRIHLHPNQRIGKEAFLHRFQTKKGYFFQKGKASS